MEPPTIVYDGECAFCRRQIERIKRWSRPDTFAFLPRQAPDLEARFPQLANADLANGLRLVHPNGDVDAGADAVYEVARRLPRTRPFAWLYRIPGVRPLAQRIYGWIAANRQRLGGSCETETCDSSRTSNET